MKKRFATTQRITILHIVHKKAIAPQRKKRKENVEKFFIMALNMKIIQQMAVSHASTPFPLASHLMIIKQVKINTQGKNTICADSCLECSTATNIKMPYWAKARLSKHILKKPIIAVAREVKNIYVYIIANATKQKRVAKMIENQQHFVKPIQNASYQENLDWQMKPLIQVFLKWNKSLKIFYALKAIIFAHLIFLLAVALNFVISFKNLSQKKIFLSRCKILIKILKLIIISTKMRSIIWAVARLEIQMAL